MIQETHPGLNGLFTVTNNPTNTDTSVNDSFSVIVERRAQETKTKGIRPFSGKVY